MCVGFARGIGAKSRDYLCMKDLTSCRIWQIRALSKEGSEEMGCLDFLRSDDGRSLN